jgi:26S proteasome regulatory subunit N9
MTKETMTKDEQFALATDISLAALTGDGVFNFGEITTTPLLDAALSQTSNAWLMELMHCFAQGDVDAFQRITDQHADAIAVQPALVSRAQVVKEKITLLALVSMIFERPSSERTLTFEEIATRTKLPSDKKDVEWLVMRALSLKLIKGCMDQVDQTLEVDWVMPRVLDQSQLKALCARYGEWAVKVNQTRQYMVDNAAS